jgi:hypothetical protein
MEATQIVSHVVPFPQLVPANQVSQVELQLLLSLRGRLSQLQSQVATAEESLKQRLQAGAIVEPGDHIAELKENLRRNVAWKVISARLALRLKLGGMRYCEQILARTKPTKTVSLELR